MVMHARSGGIYEVMGIMQGKIDPETRTIYVMDSYALPVQGTETRFSAANEAIEYMVQYSQLSETVGRFENAVGWYHSHPGYGCWLSGIDVDTRRNNQAHQDHFVAVVIDPNRTMSADRVDIGAFPAAARRTSVPQSKIDDFGVHANAYYPLEVEHFKSTLDTQLLALLWNKYWASTLSSSMSTCEPALRGGPAEIRKREGASKLRKAASDSCATEPSTRLLSTVLRDVLFNGHATGVPPPPQLADRHTTSRSRGSACTSSAIHSST
ncbi:hypothetical protein V8E36_008512 [Tilletia maclaganii]